MLVGRFAPRVMLVVLAGTLAWLAVSAAARRSLGQGAGEPKTAAVKLAREEFAQKRAKALSEHQRAVDAARDEYVEALEIGIRRATKDGDLEEANKLKAVLEELRAYDFSRDLPDLYGTWNVRWGEKAYTKYTFREDGGVFRELRNAPKKGVLRRIGSDVVIDFSDQSRIRVNLAGQRLFLEHWRDGDNYEQYFPRQVGIGLKVEN